MTVACAISRPEPSGQKVRHLLLGHTSQAEAIRAVGGASQFLIIIHFLSPADYGKLTVIVFFATVLVPLIATRVSMVAIRQAAIGESPLRLSRQLFWRAALILMTLTPLGLAADQVGILPTDVETTLSVLLAELVGGTLAQGLAAIAQGRLEFSWYRWLVAGSVGSRLLAAGVFALGTDHSLGAWARLLALMTIGAALLMCLWTTRAWAARGPYEELPPQARTTAQHDTWVFVLNAFSLRALDDVDKVLLAYFASYSVAGVYGAAYKMSSYILLPVRGVLGRFLPQMFTAGARDPALIMPLAMRARRQLTLALALAIPTLGALSLLATRLLGAGYRDSGPYVLLLIPILGARGFHYIYGDILVAMGRVRTRLAGQAVSVVLPVAAYLALIPPFGTWGAVAATGVGEAAAVVVLGRLVRRALEDADSARVTSGAR